MKKKKKRTQKTLYKKNRQKVKRKLVEKKTKIKN